MGFTSADQISPAQELSLNREISMSDIVKHFLAVSTTIAHPDPDQPDNFSADLQGFMTLIYFHSLSVTADILLEYFSFIFKCNFSSSLNLPDLHYDELLGWAVFTAAPCVYLEGFIENNAKLDTLLCKPWAQTSLLLLPLISGHCCCCCSTWDEEEILKVWILTALGKVWGSCDQSRGVWGVWARAGCLLQPPRAATWWAQMRTALAVVLNIL